MVDPVALDRILLHPFDKNKGTMGSEPGGQMQPVFRIDFFLAGKI